MKFVGLSVFCASVLLAGVVNATLPRTLSFDLNVEENNKLHYTSHMVDKPIIANDKSYDKLPTLGRRLIVRRGAPFTITTKSAVEDIKISLNPCGLLVGMIQGPGDCGVSSSAQMSNWDLKQGDGTVDITPHASAPVGAYTIRSGSETQEFLLLFNPFKKSSPVGSYSKKMDLGKDYVLDDKTIIFQGLSDEHEGHLWDLDPGRGLNVLAALHLLRALSLEHRSQPYIVSRHLTYAIGDEVCYGKWGEGNYRSGQPSGGYKCSTSKSKWMQRCHDPSTFTGSSKLLEIYMALIAENQPSSVQYCQCFVFAGVTATIGRALGIPTSVVTTFQSAHDTNGDRQISKFYEITKAGTWEPVKDPEETSGDGHGDSIWSFHVWNEMWVQRPDIKRKPKGWNAVDATPQENSHGRSQMGPAPLSFLKKNKDGCYDNQFVIGETNADVKLLYRNEGTEEPFKVDSVHDMDPFNDAMNTVGVLIVSSKPGCNVAEHKDDDESKSCKLDVTNRYKKPEPSSPGRKSKNSPNCLDIATGEKKPLVPALNAEGESLLQVSEPLFGKTREEGSVKFNIQYPTGKLAVGETSVVKLTMKNDHPSEARTVAVSGVAYGIDYQGRRIVYMTTRSGKKYAKVAYGHKNRIVLKPGKEETFELKCTLDDEKMAQIGVDTAKTSEILFTMSAFVNEDEYRFMSERRKRLIERK